MVSHDGFVAYYRFSTDMQGKSGVGVEAQRAAGGHRGKGEDVQSLLPAREGLWLAPGRATGGRGS